MRERKGRNTIEYLNSFNGVLNLEQSTFRREGIHTPIILSPENPQNQKDKTRETQN